LKKKIGQDRDKKSIFTAQNESNVRFKKDISCDIKGDFFFSKERYTGAFFGTVYFGGKEQPFRKRTQHDYRPQGSTQIHHYLHHLYRPKISLQLN
jgi:hypothetical protein